MNTVSVETDEFGRPFYGCVCSGHPVPIVGTVIIHNREPWGDRCFSLRSFSGLGGAGGPIGSLHRMTASEAIFMALLIVLGAY